VNVIIATVVKNEADRYLPACLDCWSDFSDKIVLLDDGSTDGTRELCAGFPAVDYFNLPDALDLWGHEAPHRAALFNKAMGTGEAGDVVFWLDADMCPSRNPRELFEIESITQWAFPLYDLWGRDESGRVLYRSDTYWRGHASPRVWAVRIPSEFDPLSLEWRNPRGIHSGHISPGWWDFDKSVPLIVPQDHALLHYGYHTEADRLNRHERYLMVKRMMSEEEIAHARSIIDPEPTLKRLPFESEYELEINSLQLKPDTFSHKVCGT